MKLNTNKLILVTIFFASTLFGANTSLEITTLEMQSSYNATQRLPGKILPLHSSKLAFEIPGKISEVKVDIGDQVIKDQILAVLDPSEMQANLNQALARFNLASQALVRFEDLKAKGFISNQELDRANSEYLIAKAQVDLYTVKLEQTKIRAPFTGFIQNRFLDAGVVVSPGIPILEIIDSTSVEAHVSVPANTIEHLTIGDSYSFFINNKQYLASLKRFAVMSAQGSDNRLCIFEFNTFINPGSISYLELKQKINMRGAWVPFTALSQGSQGLWNLYTLHKDQNNNYQISKEIVELIHAEKDIAFVNGTIESGDLVVTGGAAMVIDNEVLKIN